MQSRRPLSDRALARRGLVVASALALAALAACASDEQKARAAAMRAVVRSATPEGFAALLRAEHAARGACIERTFPATISLVPGDTSRRTRFDEAKYQRPYELLRDAGLVTREEVRPGDRDWYLRPSAWVDSGGTKRMMRYVLSERGRHDVEKESVGDRVVERLCYGRRRLLDVDSLVTRDPRSGWGWTPDDGVRYGDVAAWARYRDTVEDLAPWALDLARRDTLRDLMPDSSWLVRAKTGWAEFGSRGGPWKLTSASSLGPRP